MRTLYKGKKECERNVGIITLTSPFGFHNKHAEASNTVRKTESSEIPWKIDFVPMKFSCSAE
jgi:hypothetical protein